MANKNIALSYLNKRISKVIKIINLQPTVNLPVSGVVDDWGFIFIRIGWSLKINIERVHFL